MRLLGLRRVELTARAARLMIISAFGWFGDRLLLASFRCSEIGKQRQLLNIPGSSTTRESEYGKLELHPPSLCLERDGLARASCSEWPSEIDDDSDCSCTFDDAVSSSLCEGAEERVIDLDSLAEAFPSYCSVLLLLAGVGSIVPAYFVRQLHLWLVPNDSATRLQLVAFEQAQGETALGELVQRSSASTWGI